MTSIFMMMMLLLSSVEPQLTTDQIVQNCVNQMKRSVRLRSSYTYKFQDETTELSRAGQAKNRHRKLVEVMYFAGKPYERLLEKDGRPLSASEEKHEQDKMNRAAAEAAKLTEAQREEQRAKQDREREKDNEWLQFIPKAFDFSRESDAMLNGRATYVVDVAPKRDYRGKYASMLGKTRGKLFIDQRDFTLARMEADVLEPISFGLFLAKLNAGTRITFEEIRVNDEIWLPKTVTVHADARALVKSYRFDERLVFSDYRKFQSESRIVAVNEK